MGKYPQYASKGSSRIVCISKMCKKTIYLTIYIYRYTCKCIENVWKSTHQC